MKRSTYRAEIWQGTSSLAEKETFAHNSGIRASEALVRAYAREHNILLHGGKTHRDENGYSRIWRSVDGAHELVAVVVPT